MLCKRGLSDTSPHLKSVNVKDVSARDQEEWYIRGRRLPLKTTQSSLLPAQKDPLLATAMIAVSSKSILLALLVLAVVCSMAAAQFGFGRGGFGRGYGGYGGGFGRGYGGGFGRGFGGYGRGFGGYGRGFYG
ncbi:uncharacterized protein LOC119169807 [Rhipicephalus microplus]|uniref:uncharacterized protein LOC119169807 n=1 Tax=Rhipicephalus microplus TaxID=6941 RepID=UPI003F6D3104